MIGVAESGSRDSHRFALDEVATEIVPFTPFVDGEILDNEDEEREKDHTPAVKPCPWAVGRKFRFLIKPILSLFRLEPSSERFGLHLR